MGNVKVIPYKQGESFRRLKASELVCLVEYGQIPQESIFKLIPNSMVNNKTSNESNKDEKKEEINDINEMKQINVNATSNDRNDRNDSNINDNSHRAFMNRQMASNIVFYNKQDLCEESNQGVTSQQMYLLLDIREPQQYELYHIKSGMFFKFCNFAFTYCCQFGDQSICKQNEENIYIVNIILY